MIVIPGSDSDHVRTARERIVRDGRMVLAGLASLAAVSGQTIAQTAPASPAVSDAPAAILMSPHEALLAMADSLDKNPGAAVITIEGRPITQGEAADVIRGLPVSLASLGFKAVYRQALDQLLRERLLILNAQKAGFDKTEAASLRQREASDRALAEAWMNRVAAESVTEPMVKARYERDIAGKPGPVEVRARAIVVPTEEEALAVIDKAMAGGDFHQLAVQFSKDASAAAGGDLGYVPIEALAPEIGAVVFALPPGQITAFPVRTVAGYFVLRIEGRRQRATPSFEEARAGLQRELRREAATKVLAGLTADVKPMPAPAGR